MSTDATIPNFEKSALEFKSTSFSVPVLVIFSAELKQVELQLKEKISKAPDFFKNSPILIDLQFCNTSENEIDTAQLIHCLQDNALFPVGVSGGNDKQNGQAIDLHIPTRTIRTTSSAISTHKPAVEEKSIEEEATPAEPTPPSVENKLISHPIRSGQRIYAKGDLIILSHVSAGAEVMAEGNIHIYGALRGRALAGVQGNTESRIFCSDLQAELVSIAGNYQVSEDLDKAEHCQPTQIYLQEQTLIIKKL